MTDYQRYRRQCSSCGNEIPEGHDWYQVKLEMPNEKARRGVLCEVCIQALIDERAVKRWEAQKRMGL